MDEIAKYLPNSTTKRTVKKRSILIYQGEVPRQAYIVLSGCFKVYRLGSFGEEQIAGFKITDDIFPECWIFGKTPSTMYYYEALEDSEVLTVERQVFLDLLERQPTLKNELFDYMVKNYTGLMVQISALEQSRAADKLLLILYYLALRYGKQVKPGEHSIDMQLTHAMLAGLMGITRETTSAEMGRLKRKGIVYYDAKKFIVYTDALKRKIGDDSFSDIRLG